MEFNEEIEAKPDKDEEVAVDRYLRQYSDFEQAAKVIYQEIEHEDEAVEKARVATENKAIYFYRGLSAGLEVNGEYVPFDTEQAATPREATMLLSDNVLRPQVRNLMKEWSRSRTVIQVRGRNNSWKIQSGARWGDGAVKFTQEKVMDESFRQQEGKYSILTGNFFRRTYAEKPNRRSPKIKVPTYQEQQIDDGRLRCTTCMYEEPIDSDVQVCPQCDGEMRAVPPTTIQLKSGERTVKVPSITTKIIDTRGVKIPRATRRMEDHSYLRWRELAEYTEAQMRYRHVEIKPEVMKYESTLRLDTEGITTPTEFGMYGKDVSAHNRVEIDHLWLQPEKYFWLKFDEDQDFFGFKISADEELGEQFPNGLKLTFINGRIVEIREEDFRDQWIHGTYDELIESPWGDGIVDAFADQQRINEITGAQMEQALFNIFGKLFINPKFIDPSKVDNDTTIVSLKENINSDVDVKQTFAVVDPPRLNEDSWLIRDQVEARMRAKTGAYLSFTGQGDPGADTATQTAIMRDAAVAMLGLALALRSEADVEWAYQVLEHYQNNWVDEYHSKMLGDFSVEEAKAFQELDIRNDLRITIAPNSWIPRTEDEERQDFISYLTAGGIPLGFANPQIPLSIRKTAATIFRPPLEIDNIHPDIRVAQIRLNELMRAAENLPDMSEAQDEDPEQVEQITQQLAMALAGSIDVRAVIDDHAVMIEIYKDFLKQDEGLNAHKVVQEAVEILIMRHEEAMQGQAMMAANMQGTVQAAAAAPGLDQQAAMQAQQQAQQGSTESPEQQQVGQQRGKATAISQKQPDSATDRAPQAIPAGVPG